jgi:hypothetical protein
MIKMSDIDPDKYRPIRIRVPPGAIDDELPMPDPEKNGWRERPVFYDAESVLEFYREHFGKDYQVNLVKIEDKSYWELYPKKLKP